MNYPNDNCAATFAPEPDMCTCEEKRPEPSVRDLAVEIHAAADEIFHRVVAIAGFTVDANALNQTENKPNEPRCLRDELVYTQNRAIEILRELNFLEKKLGLR